MAKSRKKSKVVVIVIVTLLALVAGFCGSWFTGWGLTGEVNMAKWGNNSVGDAGDDKGDEPAQTESLLMFAPLSADSPVAIASKVANVTSSSTITLTATVTPEGAYYTSVTWSSSTPDLKVTGDGLTATVELVRTLTETATITCSVESFTTITGSCTVDFLILPTVDFSIKGVNYTNDRFLLSSGVEYELEIKTRPISGTVSSEAFSVKSTETYIGYSMTSDGEELLKEYIIGSGKYSSTTVNDAKSNWGADNPSVSFKEGTYKFTLGAPSEFNPLEGMTEAEFNAAYYTVQQSNNKPLAYLYGYFGFYYKGVLIGGEIEVVKSLMFDGSSFLTGVDGVDVSPDDNLFYGQR